MKLNTTYIGILSVSQADPHVEPNTCPMLNHFIGSVEVALIPGLDSWVCPVLTCDYTEPYTECDFGFAEEYDSLMELGAFDGRN